MLAVIAPGQGSQKPGFLTPWLELPGAESRLRWWSALAGVDLVHLGTEADADEIKDTARTQPLLVAAALLAGEHLPMHDVALTAGHSVGELGAAALAGVLPAEAAITLAAVRGREMAAACGLEPTGMAAVLGGEPAEVLAAIESYGLHAANHNGAGQIVAAGAAEKLAKFTAEKPAGARVMPLQVAGAFHTPYMATAERALGVVAAGITPADPARILLSNVDGAPVPHGREMLQRLVRQVTAPVRWDLCMRTLVDLGVTAVIELPPAGALTNLIKRELKDSGLPEFVTLRTPDDLPAARDLIARHGTAPSHEPASRFRVVVSPGAGTFEPAPRLTEGDSIGAGELIGHIATRQGPVDVAAHGSGVLTEWLAAHNDPVAPGQPLARLGGHL
ncbi:acyltransferase domain-containing protein [Polymorphospora lycopeni]|uniref:[acyl-carrier-protein] S-malonyltransferase n=1 Tax=Polymorphospora lycopeni TaxID=3140240 RepID=A0ABV5CRQ7_9ACTN